MQDKMRQYSSLKALQIISALAEAHEAMSISELTEVTGLNASTIHRILQELLECGFVGKDEAERKYSVGFEALALGMRLKTSDYLLSAALPEMKKLNDLTGETVHLIGAEGHEGIYLGKLEAKNQIGLRSRVGRRIPLHCTSGGKVILAHMPQEWLEDYFEGVEREKFTAKTLTGREELAAELERVRRQGYALDDQEHHPDIICVAAPVFRRRTEFAAAISVAAPDYRFSLEKALSWVGAVKKTAAAISRRLEP